MKLTEILPCTRERIEEYGQPAYNYINEKLKNEMIFANIQEDAPKADEWLIKKAFEFANAEWENKTKD